MSMEIMTNNISFPNEFEKEIIKFKLKNESRIKGKLNCFFLSKPNLNKFAYEFYRKKRYVEFWNKKTKFHFPTFMIPGFGKCGSTSLWYYLNQHFRIQASKQKEIHFFSYYSEMDLNRYRKNFPELNKNIQHYFEASQTYLQDYNTMKRIRDVLPNMKFIVMMRDPIDKAYSHYQSLRKNNNENKDFIECINEEKIRLQIWNERHEKRILRPYTYSFIPPYLYLSCYDIHLKNAFKLFDQKNFLLLELKELEDNPEMVVKQCFSFLKLEPVKIDYTKKNVGRYTSSISKSLKNELNEYFKPHNNNLQEIAGRKFSWC